jgi:hypothetical protein
MLGAAGLMLGAAGLMLGAGWVCVGLLAGLLACWLAAGEWWQTICRPNPPARAAMSDTIAMHALSLTTWWIHIASVLEWMLAMVSVQRFGVARAESGWRWLALAMLPALVSAMAACTWHLFDNPDELKGLVVLQAGLTAIGNCTLAMASFNLLRQQQSRNG